MEEDDPVAKEEVEADGAADDVAMEEATAATNKEKQEKEAAIEAAKAAEVQAAAMREKEANMMKALFNGQGQRGNREAAVNLTEPGVEKDGAKEDEEDDGLQDSVWEKDESNQYCTKEEEPNHHDREEAKPLNGAVHKIKGIPGNNPSQSHQKHHSKNTHEVKCMREADGHQTHEQ